jgi:hypothetical protein
MKDVYGHLAEGPARRRHVQRKAQAEGVDLLCPDGPLSQVIKAGAGNGRWPRRGAAPRAMKSTMWPDRPAATAPLPRPCSPSWGGGLGRMNGNVRVASAFGLDPAQ